MKRRRFDIFSMSFLDTICCAFGAIVLLYMILNAASGRVFQKDTSNTRSEVDKLELQVLDGYENMVAMTNALRAAASRRTQAQGESQRVLEELELSKLQLAEYEKETLARREHINQLKADLKSLEQGQKRLEAGSRDRGAPGVHVVSVKGEGDRQYLTGLKIKGKHTLILFDASASMMDEKLVNIIRLRNMAADTRRAAPKWRSAVQSAEWLLSQLPGQSQFQIYAFNTTAWPLDTNSAGKWQSAGDADMIGKALKSLRAQVPQGGTSLANAFATINQLNPRPDSVILLTDGLPTQDAGGAPLLRKTIDSNGRVKLFHRAISDYPQNIPLNVILFPMEGDPEASGLMWIAARRTGGSFMVPSKDWP